MNTLKITIACTACAMAFHVTASEHMGMRNFPWEISHDDTHNVWIKQIVDPSKSTGTHADPSKKREITSHSDADLDAIAEIFREINQQERKLALIEAATSAFKKGSAKRKT